MNRAHINGLHTKSILLRSLPVVVAGNLVLAGVMSLHLDGAALIIVLFGVGVVVAGLAFWKVPQFQANAARRQEGTKSQFELENEARRTLAEALGGLFLVIGLAVTWLQILNNQQEQRQAARIAAEQQALMQEGQITDRFTAAIAHLGDERLQVRLGGIYALERIGRDSDKDRSAVMEILAAFVRARAPWPRPEGATTPTPDAEGLYQPDADVQAALSTILRRSWSVPQDSTELPSSGLPECLDLSDTDLRGAELVGTPMMDICFNDANLSGALLFKVDLSGSNLWRADLTGALLINVDLREATLGGTTLSGASLLDVNLAHADLSGADFSCPDPSKWRMCTHLIDVDLSEATLACSTTSLCNQTNLSGTLISGSNLSNTDLTGADLSDVNLSCVFSPGSICENQDQHNWITQLLVDWRAYISLPSADVPSAGLPPNNLSGADLSGADLSGSDITGVDWNQTICPDETDSDLNGGTCEGHLSKSVSASVWSSSVMLKDVEFSVRTCRPASSERG
jgi:uncharacterized protein YjbI with pentapeptide repeats